jgi:hypothetical protein
MKWARQVTPPQTGTVRVNRGPAALEMKAVDSSRDSTALRLGHCATLPGSRRSRTGRELVDAGSIPGSFPACSTSVCRIDPAASFCIRL